jgi:acylphosphatase
LTEVIVQVKKDGSVQIQVQGHTGPGCLDLTKGIEDALGSVESRECSVEFYEAVTQDLELKA